MKSVYTKWQDEEELDEEGFKKAVQEDTAAEKQAKLKGKVRAFARVQKMYKTLT